MLQIGEEFTLKTEYDTIITPPSYDKSIVEYLLRKCYGHVLNSKGAFTIDIATGESHLYSDIEPLSRSIASAFCRRGLVENDTVISTSNEIGARSFIIFLGIWRANGSVRAHHDDETEERIIDALLESKCRFVICDLKSLPIWLEATRKIKWKIEIFILGNAEGCSNIEILFQDDGRELPPLELRLEEPILILPTGGTSGPSKSVCYTNEKLISSMQMWNLLPMVSDEKQSTLFLERMSHFSTLILPMGILTRGVTALISSKLETTIILKGIEKYKPKGLLSVTQFFAKLIKDTTTNDYDLTSVEYILAGWSIFGDQLDQTLLVFPKLSTVSVLYGMAECTMLTTSVNLNLSQNFEIKNQKDYVALDGSVGKLVPHTLLEVRDMDTGKPLGIGKVGELCFKTPLKFRGYLNNNEATDLSIRNEWLITGDIGYYDEKGFIYVSERRNEFIKVSQNHVSPTEIENIIRTFPGVEDVCVVAVPTTSTIYHPRAFVTLKLDASASADEILEYTHEKLEPYKHLNGGLHIVPKLPMESGGKISRSLVAKLCTSVCTSSSTSSSSTTASSTSSSPYLSSTNSDSNGKGDSEDKSRV